MSRKHYIALADALLSTNATPETVKAVANVLQADNPRFNRTRFLEAALGYPHLEG